MPENGPAGYLSHGRINRETIDNSVAKLIGESGSSASGKPQSLPARAYVCGGSGFVESMGNHLLDIGMGFNDIRTERFGP